MRAVREIIPGVRVALSYLSHSWTGHSPAYASAPEYSRYPKLPFFRTTDNVCVTRWKLSWHERLRLALTGSIWHSVSLANVNFQPFHLHIECPLEVKEGAVIGTTLMGGRVVSAEMPPAAVIGLPVVVVMGAPGMLNELNETETAVLNRTVTGEYMVKGYPDLGRFSTEDEALAVFAQHLRLRNKGKAKASA